MQESQTITQKSASNLALAFVMLPKARRDAMSVLYAFCREVDDVVDEMRDPSVAAARLAWWRQEVKAAFDGQPTHPATKALAPLASRYGITPVHLQSVIDGCQMDLEQSRYLDFAGLAYVTASVGLCLLGTAAGYAIGPSMS